MTDPSASMNFNPADMGQGRPTPDGGPTKERNASLWADAGRELIRNPVFVISGVVVLLVLSMAVTPWLWTSTDPLSCDINFSKQPPSADHIMGMSLLGCDYYAQAIHGSGPSIAVAVLATLGVVLLGGLTGILGGYYGGKVDMVVSRLTDVVMGVPFLLGALILLALLQSRSVWAVVFALTALGWPQVTRIMRASVISTRNMDFVQAARSLGASNSRIIMRHVLPNAIAPTVVVATISLGAYVAAEATLTFLGVGLRQPTVSWGLMINEGTDRVFSGSPHLLLVPVAFLVATVLSFILMGDAIRDALDPKLR